VVSLPELTLLFIIGLLILGPERLPRVASQIGRWVGRARRTANQLRYQLEREIALADLEKSTSEKNKATRSAPAADAAPAETADASTTSAVEPDSTAEASSQPDQPVDDEKQD
jgi:sec-independent protein translocase protein TatB